MSNLRDYIEYKYIYTNDLQTIINKELMKAVNGDTELLSAVVAVNASSINLRRIKDTVGILYKVTFAFDVFIDAYDEKMDNIEYEKYCEIAFSIMMEVGAEQEELNIILFPETLQTIAA